MLFLDWQSDGIVARCMLVFYGVLLLLMVLPRFRRHPVIGRLLPAAMFWHLAMWAFTAFWMLPYYDATGADASAYHSDGLTVAALIRDGDWSSIPWGWNSQAMQIITGFFYAPAGGDAYGMLFFSAVLGLCGSLYFCLAFSLWVNPAQLRSYALVILFLPSFAMWTGIFGKDSWMALGLGLTAYGYSSILKSRSLSGAWYLLAGVPIVTVVRPHVAALLAASMALAYMSDLARARAGSILVKIPMIALFVGMFALLASVAQDFLRLEDVSANGLQEYGQSKGENNELGGSVVEINAAPGVAGTLLAFPAGIVRVMFRPFPWEAKNVNSGMAAVENIFIIWFALSRGRRLMGFFRGIFRDSYILFSSTLGVGLLLMLSLTPNLGLLSRERAQLLPFVFAPLVAAQAVRKKGTRREGVRSRAVWAAGPDIAVSPAVHVGGLHVGEL
jgi:hypothetical protein